MILLFRSRSWIVEDAQNGTVGYGTQSPLPVVIVRSAAQWTDLHDVEKGVQCNVYTSGAARKPIFSRSAGRNEAAVTLML